MLKIKKNNFNNVNSCYFNKYVTNKVENIEKNSRMDTNF